MASIAFLSGFPGNISSMRKRGNIHFPSRVSKSAARFTCSADLGARSGRNQDLLIVGPGWVGQRVASLWMQLHPGVRVVGESRSNKNHEELKELGIIPKLAADSTDEHFRYVVFCAPPSGNDDYAGAVRSAVERTDPKGMVVFTSSGRLYRDDNRIVREDGPTLDNDTSKLLLQAEAEVLKHEGGRVIRFAGLYDLDRGAHKFFLSTGRCSGHRQGLINLIHYDDAASLVVQCLIRDQSTSGDENGEVRVFLGADCAPLSNEKLCTCTLSHPAYSGLSMPVFDDSATKTSKRYENGFTRATLGWTPRYTSFVNFMEESIERAKGHK